MNITIEELSDAGVHIGHQLRRWNPKSKNFIYGNRHGISIIDLEKTLECLKNACDFVQNFVASGNDIWFVGTKRQAQEIVREAGKSTLMPFCANRWLGGALTNFSTVRKSLDEYRKLLQMEADGSFDSLANKKEVAAIKRKMQRMHRNFEGLVNVQSTPRALFVIDTKQEMIAVLEAKRLGIPVIAIVDTNSDPTLIDYPIPANDDAVKSIKLIVDALCDAIQTGLAHRETVKAKRTSVSTFRKHDDHGEPTPEVTVSADINLDDVQETPSEQTQRGPVRRKKAN